MDTASKSQKRRTYWRRGTKMTWYYEVQEKESKKVLIQTEKWQRAIDKWSRSSHTKNAPARIIGMCVDDNTGSRHLGHWDTKELIEEHSNRLKSK